MVDTYSGRYGSGVIRQVKYPWLNPDHIREYTEHDANAEFYGINPVTAEHLDGRWSLGDAENLTKGNLRTLQRALYLVAMHQWYSKGGMTLAGEVEYEDGGKTVFFKNVESVL